jgi:hypothetical protein
MNAAWEPTVELADLIEALCHGNITPAQTARLEQLVLSDPLARRYYVRYLHMHASLPQVLPMQEQENDQCRMMNDELPSKAGIVIDLQAAAPIHHSTSSIQHSFVGGALFSYLMATVILGTALAIAWMWKLSDPVQVAARRSSPPAAQRQQEPDPKRPFVGRITGMVDCQWSDPQTEAFNGANVPLDRKYSLSSGLMEITYDAGAKVILQGPVTYEVESKDGGYLSIGKLTARMEKRSEIRDQKSEIRNQKSPDPWPLTPDLFTIRTPTATVTDLGTEFGVEVGESGSTATHVFRGVVEVQPGEKNGQPSGSAVRLEEDESVRVERRQSGVEAAMEVHRGTADAAGFVRVDQLPKLAEESRLKPFRRWQAYSQELRNDPALVAYYTFESPGADNATLPNLSAAGRVLDAQVEGAEWVQGRLPGKSALYFHGKGSGDRVVLPDPKRFDFTEAFSLGVWFQVARFRPDTIPALITKGGPAWRLQRCGSTNGLTIDPGTDEQYKLVPHTDVTDRYWHLAVAVIEPRENSHRKCLYVDGCMDSEIEVPMPLGRSDEPLWVGASSLCPEREFEGRIDEVAILARAVSVEEIAAMFKAGNPANPSARGTSHDK